MNIWEKVNQELARIKADERLNYPPANVFINAPLALVQVDLKARVETLAWVIAQIESGTTTRAVDLLDSAPSQELSADDYDTLAEANSTSPVNH